MSHYLSKRFQLSLFKSSFSPRQVAASPYSFKQRFKDADDGKKKVIILGTGWGSFSLLKDINKKLFNVTVVSPRNHFLFTPLLCATAVGSLEFRSIIEPVRTKSIRHISFHMSNAVSLDVKNNSLVCINAVRDCPTCEYTLDYDHLVVGVGAQCSTFGIPGVNEYAYFLKELVDARKVREKLINNFEQAYLPSTTPEECERLLNVVIVGGGPTGVELGAEIHDFLKEDVAKLYPSLVRKVRVTLVESHKVLSAFDENLQEYVLKKITNCSNFRLKLAAVCEVRENCVVFSDGERLTCGIVVWSTGFSPQPFVEQAPLCKNKYGQILTDQKLRAINIPQQNVFSIGDCAAVEDSPYPRTAQVAEAQGKWLAKFLNGKTEHEFRKKDLGVLFCVGDYRVLNELKSSRSRVISFCTLLVWRAGYLFKLGSWKLRIQYLMDWIKTSIFGRDTSNF